MNTADSHTGSTSSRRFGLTLALPLLLALGCDAPTPASNDAPAPAAPAAPTPAATGQVHALTIPDADPAGKPIQAKALQDDASLKVMSIRLRGVELPPHSSEFPVVIAAVSGSGTVVVGEQRVPIDPTHPVTLPPGLTHEVIPDAGGELVLLVVHARG
jgi:mannose-6-phosphate isomerase-like protein (cupin superfamily)